MSLVPPPQFLLCAPEFFEVSYRINPWMDPAAWKQDQGRYAALAHSQWQGLDDLLRGLGAKVELMPPVQGLPDMVFTANGGVVLDRKALLPNFRHPERQGETRHFAAHFANLKTRGLLDEVHALSPSVAFEGAGDCLWDSARKMFWMGWGQRSELAAAPLVSGIFQRPVVDLELVDPRFYHLDTCLRPLGKGHILYYPAAFSARGQAAIAEQAGADYLVPVDEADATQFAVNTVAFDEHVVLSSATPPLKARLETLGYKIHETPLWAFHRSGGSALCLTLRLDQRSTENELARSEKSAA